VKAGEEKEKLEKKERNFQKQRKSTQNDKGSMD
jgi:hypothetical protein